ncbi:hypothetical protein SAMN05660330_03668 [Desulforhopalus singaporensis]|uniref:Uncharacterized protein n=1 Tax=Desulforhopalus singaporensis TaxID=91360 RepID=A0A1H0UPG3_9BACT|nr:hypothetical protein SAMN05660330_03668 [Desulforhopalus singaporensis]
MKFWLPDSLYRLKPLLIGFAGASLLYLSKNLFISVLGVLCVAYAFWILVMRLLWSSAVTIKARRSSARAGQRKIHRVNFPSK